MEYEKSFIGRTLQWTCFTVCDETKIIALASKDGTIFILSQENTIIYEKKIGFIEKLQFLEGKDILIGLGDEFGFHYWNISENCELFTYNFHRLECRNGISIQCFHYCKELSSSIPGSMHPILLGDSNGDLQMVLFDDNNVLESNIINIQMTVSSLKKKISQIITVGYDNETLIIILLLDHIIVKVECKIKWILDKSNDLISISLEISQTMPIDCKDKEISQIEKVFDGRILICTNDGRYGFLEPIENRNYEITNENIMFPYGPFPCKKINKCISAHFPKIDGQCCIFSGGMPAITYKSLNTISISIENEPEICFTFDDSVIDFTVRSHPINEINEIIMLTVSEIISLSYQNERWISEINYQLSPFSKNEISSISNIIEIFDKSGTLFDSCYDSSSVNANYVIQIFAVSYNNNIVSIWSLNDDHYSLLDDINLNNYYKPKSIQVSNKPVVWPRFQKCGRWKNRVKEPIVIELMKLIKDSDGTIFLLISTNRKSIFLYKIALEPQDNDKYKNQNKIWTHHHVFINNNLTTNDEINHCANNQSNLIYLITLISFSDAIEVFVVDFNTDNNTISVAARAGVAIVDINTGKYIFIPIILLEQIESLKSGIHLTELFRKTFRKRKSSEIPTQSYENNELQINKNDNTKSNKLKSMFLWNISNIELNIVLGFINGSVIIVYVTMNTKTGEYTLKNSFKKCFSNTDQEIINVQIFEIKTDSITSPNNPTICKNMSFTDSEFFKPTLDSSHNSSISGEMRSICTNNTNSFYNDDISRKSITTLSFKSPQDNGKESAMKLLLFRCDPESVKIIDYIKMKTKFKFKIKDYYNNSIKTTMSKRKTTNSNTSIPKILLSRITRTDPIKNDWQCQLLLTNHVILELHIPTLSPLRTMNFNLPAVDYNLISMNDNIIIIGENKYSNSHLILLSGSKNIMKNINRPSKVSHSTIQKETVENNVNEESDQMDFMKEAKSSLNSLLW